MKPQSLYISSHERAAGSLIVTMGMMEYLKASQREVAFFRPFVEDKQNDHDTNFFIVRYALDLDIKDTFAFSVQEAEQLISLNKFDYLIEKILEKYKSLEQKYDFVLIEGLHQSCFSATLDMDINLEVAKNLGSPYAVVLKGNDKTAQDVYEDILIESASIKSNGVSHFATFANRLDENIVEELRAKVDMGKPLAPVYYLPEVEELDMPTIYEIKKGLGSKIIAGSGKDFKKVVRNIKVAAMRLENFLDYLQEGDLIIVPSDRADIIVGAISAIYSKNYPNISGILLSSEFDPSPSVLKILDGYKDFPVPIMTHPENTFQSAMKVEKIPATINPNSERKIALSMGLFNSAVDHSKLDKLIDQASSSSVTPVMFEYGLFQRASHNKKKIVLPESMDERILRACEILLRRDVVEVFLLGDVDEIQHRSGALGLDIKKATIINPLTSAYKSEFAKIYYEKRKHKGMTYEAAVDLMTDVSYFATMMVETAIADGMVSGAVHTTAETIRPALQIIKTKPDTPIVSSLFFMCLKTKVLVYADCAVNQDPDAQELAAIAISSANSAMQFGIVPKIAMLSYSTGSSGSGEDVEKVVKATQIVKEKRPDLLIEGPIQYDAAVDKEVAKVKLPESKVAGEATVFIFPDLNTGNNTYKAVQRSSNALAIGPVLQGLRKPINDLSRGCLVSDIVNTVVITAIQAAGEE